MEKLNERQDVLTSLREIARREGIENFKISNVKTNEKGVGFLADICYVTISDQSATKSLDLVLKLAATDEKTRKLLCVRKAFENEVTFYTEVIPNFEQLLGDDREAFKITPKCYAACLEEGREFLVLENLKSLGYKLVEKKVVLDDQYMRLCFEKFGIFHGLSLALKTLKNAEFTRISAKFHRMWDHFGEFCNDALVAANDLVKNSLKHPQDDQLIEYFKKFDSGTKIIEILKQCQVETKYSVITHGDCWSNNLLFSYSGELADLLLIDFQGAFLSSPVLDLCQCMYAGASKAEFARFDEYLRIYYRALSAILTRHDLDPDVVFPYETLISDWRKYAKFGYVMCLDQLKIVFTDDDFIEDLVEMKEKSGGQIDEKGFDVEGFTARMKEVLEHLNQYG